MKSFAEGQFNSTLSPTIKLLVMREKEIDIYSWKKLKSYLTLSYVSTLQMDIVHRGKTPGYVRTDVLGFK